MSIGKSLRKALFKTIFSTISCIFNWKETVSNVKENKPATKKDIRELLWDKLPEVMDDKQKESKVKNFLAQMRRT